LEKIEEVKPHQRGRRRRRGRKRKGGRREREGNIRKATRRNREREEIMIFIRTMHFLLNLEGKRERERGRER
jgi:hypothetical protein